MEFRVYFKHMDSSLPLYAYAEKKLGERIGKYSLDPLEAHVTFDVDGDNHRAQCQVSGTGFNVTVEHADPENMYSCIDILADKLDRRLRRQKEKLRSHKIRRVAELDLYRAARAEQEELEMSESVDAAAVIRFEQARLKMLARRSASGGVERPLHS